MLQLPRVAKARLLGEDKVRELIERRIPMAARSAFSVTQA